MKNLIVLTIIFFTLCLNVNANTVAYWRFEEGTNGSSHFADLDGYYKDSSGNGNDMGSWYRSAPVTDVPFAKVPQTGMTNAAALRFLKGKNMCISTCNTNKSIESYMFTSGWTIEASFKHSYQHREWEILLGKDDVNTPGNEAPFWFQIRFFGTDQVARPWEDGRLELGVVDDSGTWLGLYSINPIEKEKWYSVAAVFDTVSSTISLYLKSESDADYVLQDSLSGISGVSIGTWGASSWTVGRGMFAGNECSYANASIDEVRITAQPLSENQFLAATGGAAVSPLAYWRFEEGTNGIHNADMDDYYKDSSGNGNDMSTTIPIKKCEFAKQNSLISWSSTSNFIQVSFDRTSKYGTDEIYMWGTQAGRFGGLKLAKFLPTNILNKSEYKYFAGYDGSSNPIWSADENDAEIIVDYEVGEPCVRYNPYLDKWMLIYLKSNNLLVLQLSENPWGPFSDPVVLATQSQYPLNYNGYMHEKYFEQNGKIVYFLMSQYFPIYNVRLMKMEFDNNYSDANTVSSVGFVTGKLSINKTTEYDVAGTDLGIMFFHNNKMFFVFGDTFDTLVEPLTGWRSNVMSFSTDFNASDNIKFDSWVIDRFYNAKEFISSKKIDGVEITSIPTAAISINSTVYVHYMSVKTWGEPGEWEVNYSSFAVSEQFDY